MNIPEIFSGVHGFTGKTVILPNCLLTSPSFSLTLLLKGKKFFVISVGNLFSSFFFHVDVVEQISW